MRAITLFLPLCVACASEWADVGPMLTEARNNDLAAAAKYRSKELKLAGIVTGTGEKKMEHGSAHTGGEWRETIATEADHPYPYVQIRDAEHPSPDVVTCYFTQGDVATPAKGDTVHIRGVFVEYAVSGGKVDAVLERCAVVPDK